MENFRRQSGEINQSITFCGVVQVCVDGRTPDNIVQVEDHRFDILFRNST
jgi:hypothetical protein